MSSAPPSAPFVVLDDSFVLDQCRSEDAEAQRALALDPSAARFLGWTIEEARAAPHEHYDDVLRRFAREWRSGTRFALAIRRRSSGEAVGSVELRPSGNEASISYLLSPALRGRGIAPRAVDEIIAWGARELGIEHYNVFCHVENIASQRVAEKCGFGFLGREGEELRFRLDVPAHAKVARRIAIIGVSGNGKTTLGRRLAAQLNAPHVELDALCHLSGWREANDEEFRRAVEKAMTPSRWVLDGTYDRKLGDLVYERADLVVWLDLPLPRVLYRLIGRALRDIVTQRDLFNGNTQTWRFAFFERDSLVSYAIKQHYRRRRLYPRKFAEMRGVKLVRLRSPREVEAWLAQQTLRP